MIAFVDDHREIYGVEPICRVLPIAPSTYHAHVAERADPAMASARVRQDLVLMEEIRRVRRCWSLRVGAVSAAALGPAPRPAVALSG